jgi:hypothetical protein
MVVGDLATITAVLIGGASDGEQIEVHPHARTIGVHIVVVDPLAVRDEVTDFRRINLSVNKFIYHKQDPPDSSPVKFYLQPPWLNKTHHTP